MSKYGKWYLILEQIKAEVKKCAYFIIITNGIAYFSSASDLWINSVEMVISFEELEYTLERSKIVKMCLQWELKRFK